MKKLRKFILVVLLFAFSWTSCSTMTDFLKLGLATGSMIIGIGVPIYNSIVEPKREAKREAEKQKQDEIDAYSKALSDATNIDLHSDMTGDSRMEKTIEPLTVYLSKYSSSSEYYNEVDYKLVETLLEEVKNGYEKETKDYENLKNAFLKLKKAFDAKHYDEIDNLYNQYIDSYSKYFEVHFKKNYLNYYKSDADKIKDETFRILNPWKETEKCKSLVNAVNKTWLNLPVYIANEDTGLTIKDILEYCDLRVTYDGQMYITQYSTYIKLEASLGFYFYYGGVSLGFYYRYYRFDIVLNGNKLLIQSVYVSNELSSDEVFSDSASDIKDCFNYFLDEFKEK